MFNIHLKIIDKKLGDNPAVQKWLRECEIILEKEIKKIFKGEKIEMDGPANSHLNLVCKKCGNPVRSPPFLPAINGKFFMIMPNDIYSCEHCDAWTSNVTWKRYDSLIDLEGS